jgi:hypothetical protein
MNTNDGFKLAGKRGKRNNKIEIVVASVVETVPKKPIIVCEHCQRPGHIKDKCFIQEKLEKLKTAECVYCHEIGHTNFDCPVSKAKAEKKAQFVKKQKEKEAKFNADFPIALSTTEPKQKDNSSPILKFAWASVAMANRNPEKVQKLEEDEAALKNALKNVEKEKRKQEIWEKQQKKLAAEKKKWYKIRPVILALKIAFPRSWFHKVENTPYDINQASELRDEEERKRDQWEFEQEQLEWEEEKRYQEESKEREEKRAKMTTKELEEDYRQIEEDYEDSAMNEQNMMFCRMFREQYRPKRQCDSCSEWLEQDNQGTKCVACIFQLGPFAMKK